MVLLYQETPGERDGVIDLWRPVVTATAPDYWPVDGPANQYHQGDRRDIRTRLSLGWWLLTTVTDGLIELSRLGSGGGAAAARVEQLAARGREIEEQIRQNRGATAEQLREALSRLDRARRAAVTSAEFAATSAESAAEAEDRVAELHDQLADAGIGDPVAHRRAAAEHRQAGIYDRDIAAQERREAARRAGWHLADPAP